MKKYAVLVSDETGARANFEALDLDLESAVKIAAGKERVDCAPVGRADRSFVRSDGTGLVWSVVVSNKNK